jgi:[ribosomal protein S5]-alanine N-acetyltransferase
MARMLAVPYPYPDDGATTWIAKARPGQDFAIVLRETDEVIGGITIEVSEQHRRASLGYWCGVDYWGRGYATEAVSAVIGYGFRKSALNRVHAECHGDNPASRRVLEKAGMTFEGRLRLHSFRVDRFADKLQFGVLRDEWLP